VRPFIFSVAWAVEGGERFLASGFAPPGGASTTGISFGKLSATEACWLQKTNRSGTGNRRGKSFFIKSNLVVPNNLKLLISGSTAFMPSGSAPFTAQEM